ncbi:hemin uptake protein HemP [Uliginosibacterium sp. H3]|uniref:Hemin uptake protein HemP n=1 Tax=Uliginosibacterium silvisoli TaxID=3114758 RepID=A0ABU6K0G9_9RHOO|nr:hemin uptake protein HemP [Uliginosibacterium sp. H3]
MNTQGLDKSSLIPQTTPPSPLPQHQDSLRVVTSSELLRGQVCVNIEHAGALYTLRATRSGKLILTK